MGAVAASQLLFPRKEKPCGSGLLPVCVFEGAKGQSQRELDHVDSRQGLFFRKSQVSMPMADCPNGSLLWLACLLCRSPLCRHRVGSVVLVIDARAAAETFEGVGIHAKGGCVARSNRAGEGGGNQILFFRLENAGVVVKAFPLLFHFFLGGKNFSIKYNFHI